MKHFRRWLPFAATLCAALGVAMHPHAPAFAAAPDGCNNNLACIKTFGDNAAQQRVLDLNNLSNDAMLHANIPADERSAIEQDAQTNIAAVQTIKGQIDAATTPAAARAAILQLQNQLRIYLVVLPRDYLHLYQEHQAYIQATFAAAEPKIQQAIQTAMSQGKNVGQAQQQFSDLQARVSDAGTQNAAAAPLFAGITVTNVGSGANDTAFTQIRTHLQPARFDLEAAYTDLTQIIGEVG